MTNASRKARGMRTQLVIAQHLTTHGFPHAETTGSGRSGSDILGTPGLAIEVKARRAVDPLAWIRQAASNAGLPCVIFRPDGLGETRVGEWPVMMRLDDWIGLVRAAGYGEPLNTPADALEGAQDATGPQSGHARVAPTDSVPATGHTTKGTT